jgi:hypothetical protein
MRASFKGCLPLSTSGSGRIDIQDEIRSGQIKSHVPR